ncbi:MAG: creatininase family protein [Bacteroidota bacterium]
MVTSPLLSRNHWRYVKDAIYDLAILPWGATEAHNFHLPYGTDVFEAEAISAESARLANEMGARTVVLPVIPFGVNTGQHDIKLDINLNPSTQLLILDDVIAGLLRHGIYKLLVLNAHGGNDFRQMLRELGLKYPDMWLFQANFYQIPLEEKLFDEPDDHAGEMETSLMLYLFPDLVLPLSEAGDGASKSINISAFQQKWAWTEREWSKVTRDTGVGNPRYATAEKGEKYFTYVTRQIAAMLKEVAGLNRDEAYS